MDAPFGIYPTTDGWVSIAMSPFKTLVGVLRCEALLAYDSPQALFEKRDEVWERLARETKKWSTADLMDALLAADIWCGEIKTHRQVAEDPQVKHMECLTSYEHPVAGSVRVVSPAIKMSKTPPRVERPAPLVGQHSREILKELGFAETAIDDLVGRGVVGEAQRKAHA
jgi:crotonobetainyl-CoA:carnitine CoA-transferase CaiB-like acyl-CoA transferase